MGHREIALPKSGVHLYESRHEYGDKVDSHHHKVHQILYALEGEGTIVVNGQHHHVLSDGAVFLPPLCEHAVICNHKMTLLVLAFDQFLLGFESLSELLSTYFSRAFYITLNPFSAAEFRQLLRKLLFEQSKASVTNEIAMKIHLLELLLVLVRSVHNPKITGSNELRANRIRAYIDENYFERITADSIAEKISISARYVNELFKEQYGITPVQYLNNIRVELAKKMLIETNKDTASIGFEVGYETLSTFYRNFKNHTQMAPAKYRQAHASRTYPSSL